VQWPVLPQQARLIKRRSGVICNVDLPVAAHSQDPLQVCDRRRHGNLMGHNELTHHVVFLIFELHNLRDDAIAVSLAEGGMI